MLAVPRRFHEPVGTDDLFLPKGWEFVYDEIRYLGNSAVEAVPQALSWLQQSQAPSQQATRKPHGTKYCAIAATTNL